MKEGWVTKKLGEVFEIERGGSPRPIDKYLTDAPNGINWIKIGDTKNVTKYITKTEEKIRPEGVKRSRMVYEGDFILSNSMSFGRPYIMKTSGCIHDGWLVFRESERNVNKDYLYYVLSSNLVFQQFDRLAAGSTVRNLNIGLVKGVEIPIPPLSEQKRIVGILDETFGGIAIAKANAEKNLENARALFESHSQTLFTRRGSGWVEKKLGAVAESISTGPFGTMLHKSDYVRDGIPLVNPMNIVGPRIVPSSRMLVSEETRERLRVYVLNVGDIVIARRGELGKCAIVTDKEAGWLCGTGSFFVRLSNIIDGKYFVALFSSKQFRMMLENSAVGTTMSNLNHTILNELPILVPPIAEQRAIMERADEMLCEVERLESIYRRKLEALEELKKSLLHKAFMGEL
jgi:type I restriction enzyme S subunit